MYTKVLAATTVGVNAHLVQVEVDLSYGMLQFNIVGLPDTAIKESRQRIVTALKNCGVRLPERKITVNLAPADLKKVGTLFDLPIALGILQASEQIKLSPAFLEETVFLGELSLDGTIASVKGVLPIASDLYRLGKKRLIVPAMNAQEAALITGLEVIGADHIQRLVSALKGEIPLTPVQPLEEAREEVSSELDLAQVLGQEQAKRLLQIAAAGHHNVLFVGSPGSGKTMLAQRLHTILPPMAFDEIIETSKIYSISGKLVQGGVVRKRPVRMPHHTISQAGLVGGGSFPQPGEISLAHHGVLFLDELLEFKRSALEALRQPLESKLVSIARAEQTITFPASFLLVAALNPCPCGYFGDKMRECTCSAAQVKKYLERLSGPLLDRIDLQLALPSVSYEKIIEKKAMRGASSAELYVGVERAVVAQKMRATNNSFTRNAFLSPDQIERICSMTEPAQALMKIIFTKFSLSMRGYHKLLRVARTIADIEGSEIIDVPHLQEASMYRAIDRFLTQA